MQDEPYEIRKMCKADIPGFWDMLQVLRFDLQSEYYARCIERHDLDELTIVIASSKDEIIGFALLNRQPKYGLYKKLAIPEIQDLNVVPQYRRRGIGEGIIAFCEALAVKEGNDTMGIGVGLDSTFGSAQRLYVRLGYIPDGQGVTYDRQPVAIGDFKPIDENLSLMMTKSLKN